MVIGREIRKKIIDGKEYTATHSSIFAGRGRKKKAKEYVDFMRNEGFSCRTIHDENKSVVWRRFIKKK